MPYIENFEEFKARQGGDCIQIKNGDFEEAWLFSNGAACELQKAGSTRTLYTREPPQEKFGLLRAKKLYLHAKIEQESQAYQRALADCQQQANWAAQYPHSCPAVPKTAVNGLRDWWDAREKLRAELEQLDKQLAQSPEAILARQKSEVFARDAATLRDRQTTASILSSMGPNTPPPAPAEDIVEAVGNYLKN